MNLKIQVFESENAFELLHDDWQELTRNNSRRCVFTTWEWQSNWWAAYHPGDLWILAVRDESDTLVGLAPWFIHGDHPKGRLVRSVGCVDVTDYLEPILRDGYEEAALRTITQYAREHQDRYDALDFCNIPEASPVLGMWCPILEEAGYRVIIKQQEVCPILQLPDTWDEYLMMLDKKNRHEIRRKLRRTEGVGYDIDWHMVSPEDELQIAMQRFLKLMASSNPDKAAFLEDPQHVDFFNRIMPVMMDKGWLAMSFLTVEGEDAAAYVSFDYDNHIMLYNSGHDPAKYRELSPGIVLLVYIIEDAIKKGRDVFDFLRGNEEYKYRLGGVDTAVMMLNARLQ